MEKLPQPKITLYERHKCGQLITTTLTLAELDMTVKNDTTELFNFTHDFTQSWEPPEPVKRLIEATGSIESISFDGLGYEDHIIFCLQCKEDYLFPGRHLVKEN